MTVPAAASPWLPLETVLAHLGVEADAGATIDRARAAAGAYVERVRGDLWAADADDPDVAVYVPTPDVLEGAVLLAARWHARKGSPVGLASFAEFGATQVVRLDVDVERLLGLGRYAGPVIG